MSSRVRAIGFACGALACGVLAAGAAGGYSATESSGELRDVVVAAAALGGDQPLDAESVRRRLTVRRVPRAFVPPDALANPLEAVGMSLAAPLAAGSYVTRGLLAEPVERASKAARPGLGGGRTPLEVEFTGGAALTDAVSRPGSRVDVVVTTETGPGGGPGRTYVAARRVPLLGLRKGGAGSAGIPGQSVWVATVGLRRGEALELIQAQAYSRSVRLLVR